MDTPKREALSKHWCFTLNNPEPDDHVPEDLLTYGVVGDEVGDEGTRHLQGYCEFKNYKRLTAVKKLLPRAHWEKRKGTPQEAADYCKKDAIFKEFGILSTPGQAGGSKTKKNWEEAKALAIAGNLEDIAANIYVPHYNTLRRIQADHAPKVAPIDQLNNEWHAGPTGTGKSRMVRTTHPEAFIKDANQWWDGYNGEDVVIVEDVDKYDVKLGRHIKLWGDHYSFPADMKHQGKKDIRPSKIIITSNYLPEEIWEDEKTYAPIRRRYKVIRHLPPLMKKKTGLPPTELTVRHDTDSTVEDDVEGIEDGW